MSVKTFLAGLAVPPHHRVPETPGDLREHLAKQLTPMQHAHPEASTCASSMADNMHQLCYANQITARCCSTNRNNSDSALDLLDTILIQPPARAAAPSDGSSTRS